MSIHLGPVNQNGYVIPDLDAAMDGWLGLGVGPWIVYRHVPLAGFSHRGVDQDPDVSIALANTGSLQIELIQPHDDVPSLYTEFLSAHPEGGLQHLGYWTSEYDRIHAECLERGWEVGQTGRVAGVRFTYFDTEFDPGTCMEIADIDEQRRAGMARIEQLALDWDGTTNPIREVDLR